MENEFFVLRTCKKCNNTDKLFVSKRELVFELFDKNKIWNTPCTKCGKIECSSVGFSQPEIDEDLWSEWARNDELSFMSQDEDLIIAEEKYLPKILLLLDSTNISNWKRIILASALCVLYRSAYDYRELKPELVDKIGKELIKHKDIVIQSKSYIMDKLFTFVQSNLF
jgi:hypothetical protein